MCTELAKYWKVDIDRNGPAIDLFHAYQKLVVESRQEKGINPYPYTQIANFDILVKAIQQIAKNMVGR
jgi:hypothetical protein